MATVMPEHTFTRWVKDYRGIVLKVTRAYAHSREDGEDLSQEILLQLWRSIPSFRGESSESTWIYRVALNTAMTWRRNGRSNHSAEPPPEDTPCPKPLPDANAANREVVDWLYAELAALSKVDRSLMLLYLDGIGYRSMSEILGMTESNVGVRLNRLKQRLAERMKGARREP